MKRILIIVILLISTKLLIGQMVSPRGVTATTPIITSADTTGMLDTYLTEDRARVLDSDTIPLFIFGADSGATADTALFNDN
jgi:hypothetical protein